MQSTMYTPAEIELMKAHFPHMTSAAFVAAHLPHRSLRSVQNKAHKMQLGKTKEHLAEISKKTVQNIANEGTRFKKGQKPWNAGLKGLQIGGRETRFKKGHRPHNQKQANGALSVRKDGENSYLFIRIDVGHWIPYHVYLYTQTIGPVPPNHIIVFADGNRANLKPENLLAITRAQHAIRNSWLDKPIELKQLYLVKAMLTRQINNKLKYEK